MPLGDFLCPIPLQHKQKAGCAHAGGTCLGHPGAPLGGEGVADPEPTLNSPEQGVMGTTPPITPWAWGPDCGKAPLAGAGGHR